MLAPLLPPYTLLAGFRSSRRLPPFTRFFLRCLFRFVRVLPFSPPAWPVRRESLSVFLLGKGGLPASEVKAQRMSPQDYFSGPRRWLYTVACSMLTAAVTATVFSLSYGESPAGPVHGSDANGDLV